MRLYLYQKILKLKGKIIKMVKKNKVIFFKEIRLKSLLKYEAKHKRDKFRNSQ